MSPTAYSGILPDSKRLDVDFVVNRVLALFPSGEVQSEDLYESERLRTEDSVRALADKGIKIKHKKLMLNDIENRRAFFGEAKLVVLPNKQGIVEVYVKAKVLRFFTENSFDEETLEKVSNLFQELDIPLILI